MANKTKNKSITPMAVFWAVVATALLLIWMFTALDAGRCGNSCGLGGLGIMLKCILAHLCLGVVVAVVLVSRKLTKQKAAPTKNVSAKASATKNNFTPSAPVDALSVIALVISMLLPILSPAFQSVGRLRLPIVFILGIFALFVAIVAIANKQKTIRASVIASLVTLVLMILVTAFTPIYAVWKSVPVQNISLDIMVSSFILIPLFAIIFAIATKNQIALSPRTRLIVASCILILVAGLIGYFGVLGDCVGQNPYKRPELTDDMQSNIEATMQYERRIQQDRCYDYLK